MSEPSRKEFLLAASGGVAAAMVASAPEPSKADPPAGLAFDYMTVDSFHLDDLTGLSAQGWEIKAVLPAEIKGHNDFFSGNGSAWPYNGFKVLLQRRKP